MRVFVTGASGFLGSYLVEELLERGHEVGALVRPHSDTLRLARIREQICFVVGSIDNVSGLRQAIAAFRPDAIAHLAWEGVNNRERNSPAQARNVAATVELAQVAVELGVRVFVGAGSQAEYGPYHRAIKEDYIAQPTTLYGMAKLAAGTMTAELCRQNELRFAWMRVFSTYGPRDHDHWLIPDVIRTLKAGRRMSLTQAEQLWGFLHARDAAAGFRTVIECQSASGIFNLGSPEAPPLRDTITAIRDLIDPAGELGFGDIPYRPDQVMVLKADVTRLQSLGWLPTIPLPAGLQETVSFYDSIKQL